MLRDSQAFSGFSVKDQATAKEFFQNVLGISVTEDEMGLHLHFGETEIFVYEKPNHEPASYTILNFPVEDINAVVDELVEKGVKFERYEGMPAEQDERGILRGKAANAGPDIAWFKDPSGNIFSLLN